MLIVSYFSFEIIKELIYYTECVLLKDLRNRAKRMNLSNYDQFTFSTFSSVPVVYCYYMRQRLSLFNLYGKD